MRTFFLLALLLPLVPLAVDADTIYRYEGRPFVEFLGSYTAADRITGSFTVADGFVVIPTSGGANFNGGIVSYSWTDGHQILTEANSTGTFRLTFDGCGTGGACLWDIRIGSPVANL